MADQKYKPCLTLIDRERQATQRALEKFNTRNQDFMQMTMQHTTSNMGQSVRTMLADESIQNLHDNPNFIASLTNFGLTRIGESHESITEANEENQMSTQQLFKTIKGQDLFSINGKFTRVQNSRLKLGSTTLDSFKKLSNHLE